MLEKKLQKNRYSKTLKNYETIGSKAKVKFGSCIFNNYFTLKINKKDKKNIFRPYLRFNSLFFSFCSLCYT